MLGPQRILVVDDTPSLLDLVRDLLETEGYAISTCLLSREALRLARRFRPDLVILDIVMPEISGWDVLKLLRKDHLLQHVPIVICTAWAEEAAEDSGPTAAGTSGCDRTTPWT